MSENTESLSPELEDLLSGDWSDLPDGNNFDAWPAGTYQAQCTANIKEVAGHPSVELSFKLLETVELANPGDDVAPNVGTTNSELCMLDSEIGKASLKKFLKIFGQHFGVANKRELIDMIQGVDVIINNKPRWDKKNEVWRFRCDAIAVV